jgi:uncharacterized protein
MTRVVYLHGFASSPASTKARYFQEKLEAAGALVDVPDLAGGDFQHLTITGQLRVLERVAGGRPVSLIGSSMGGYLAALYAARHAEVERIALLAPAFGFARRWKEELGPARIEEWRRAQVMPVFHYGANSERDVGFQLLEDAERYEDYPDFQQPSLIFHGSQDGTVPVRYSVEFTARHPNARLEIVDSGHDLVNVLEDIAPKLVRFLSGTGFNDGQS